MTEKKICEYMIDLILFEIRDELTKNGGVIKAAS
jgi:hypothetical protein